MANTIVIDAAAALEVFNRRKPDELLHLNQIGLRSAVLPAIGYREVETDVMLKLTNIQKSSDELLELLG